MMWRALLTTAPVEWTATVRVSTTEDEGRCATSGASLDRSDSPAHHHQAKGKWLVSFYVGVPVFDESPVKAPAAYPLEKQGKPDPADSLEVTINGISQVSVSGSAGMVWSSRVVNQENREECHGREGVRGGKDD